MFDEHFKRDHVIVDVPLLLKTFNSSCTHLSCTGTSKVLNSKMLGSVLTVSWECSEGHLGCWRSSNVLCQKNGYDVYTNSLLMAAGIFISGNNFDKLSLFNDLFGLGFISKTTYNRMQTHFVIPEVTRYWEQNLGVHRNRYCKLRPEPGLTLYTKKLPSKGFTCI